MPLLTNFDVRVHDICDKLLLRQVAQVNAALPSLMPALFGPDCLQSSSCLHNERLVFSEGEPAINFYWPPGGFEAHEDKQSLTCLLNLSAEEDYVGGGTAFWSTPAGDEHNKPTLIVRPPIGTAIIFAGSVTHAGVAIASGKRIVLVASFSPVAFRSTRAFEAALRMA